MTYATRSRGWSPGRAIIAAVLAVIAVLAIIACILYFTEPARSLPSVLGAITHPASRADAHRSTRGWTALAIAVICLVAAGLVSRQNRSSPR
jgi:undecaprenyl pyrophosphate phosphatase UppP